jgi:hypothetical protein
MSRDLGAVPVGCFAHQMHLVVTDLLPFFAELSVILDKISSVVTFFRQSVIAAQALQAMCKKEEHVKWATPSLLRLIRRAKTSSRISCRIVSRSACRLVGTARATRLRAISCSILRSPLWRLR